MKKLTFTCLLMAVVAAANAQSDTKFSMKDSEEHTGSHIKRDIGHSSSLPFDKSYQELTPEQQAIVKANYESMGPGDEPPYPAKGLAPLYRVASQALSARREYGLLEMSVVVGADGTGKSVKIYQTPDDVTAKIVALAMMHEKYKPALCKGQPCEQEFLLKANLSQ
jgi:hypothetical protein